MGLSKILFKNFFVAVYGCAAAAMMTGLWWVLKSTVRVVHIGIPEGYSARQTIDCAWHDSLLPYFIGAMPYAKPYVWMNHPAWYMKGIHLFLLWMGVQRLALGSSGHGGKAALSQLLGMLGNGAAASTFLNPDGPYGPAHVVKNGVLDLSQHSGLPVLAIRVVCSRAVRLPTWDRKWVPLPGSQISFFYSPLMEVGQSTREEIRLKIQHHLNGSKG